MLGILDGGDHASVPGFRDSDGYITLRIRSSQAVRRLSRVIVLVEEVDSLYSKLKESGLEPESPRDGDWGERFFHLKDPDGHELSFAQLLR